MADRCCVKRADARQIRGNSPESDDNQKTIKPILRWAGSKQRSLPNIAPHLPTAWGRYVELFAGSACLFFHLDPKRAILVDNNVDLMRFYEVAKKDPIKVFQMFERLPRDPDTYYSVRQAMISERNALKRAAYFLYLNRNCFNGIYRTNNRGEFNVPFFLVAESQSTNHKMTLLPPRIL
ncbi:DNA adenine methylase [Bradyrhizobium sp. TZ2]